MVTGFEFISLKDIGVVEYTEKHLILFCRKCYRALADIYRDHAKINIRVGCEHFRWNVVPLSEAWKLEEKAVFAMKTDTIAYLLLPKP